MTQIIQKNLKPVFLLLMALFSFLQTAHAEAPKALRSPAGIAYMTGGIGVDQVEEMRPYAKNFTLNLLFSEGTVGRSVTDVNVNIYNEKDERVFRIVGAKPVLYVNLPAGNYMILANNNGQKLRHKLTIEGGTNKKVILNWKDVLIEEDQLDSE